MCEHPFTIGTMLKLEIDGNANVTCEQTLMADAPQTIIHYIHTFLNNDDLFCLIFYGHYLLYYFVTLWIAVAA